MEAHVGSKGPGAMGNSSFTSGKERKSPNGTLSSACGGGTAGIGMGAGRVAQPVIIASAATTAINWYSRFQKVHVLIVKTSVS
jgi:hypothetical protein